MTMSDPLVKAFPFVNPMTHVVSPGMDLRDWFAGMALIGATRVLDDPESCAVNCYQFADAMMAARQKEQSVE
jgi:hypothetical protein